MIVIWPWSGDSSGIGGTFQGGKKLPFHCVYRNVEMFPPKVNSFQLPISGNNQLYLSIEIELNRSTQVIASCIIVDPFSLGKGVLVNRAAGGEEDHQTPCT